MRMIFISLILLCLAALSIVSGGAWLLTAYVVTGS